jgi:hypothetical protein
MIPRVNIQSIALVLFFTLCQVIGTMCVLPDMSMAEQPVVLVEDVMTCPMDGVISCPPSAISSPERQGKHGSAGDVDHATLFLTPSLDLTMSGISTLSHRSSASSIVPVSIGSSSVLRI